VADAVFKGPLRGRLGVEPTRGRPQLRAAAEEAVRGLDLRPAGCTQPRWGVDWLEAADTPVSFRVPS
jgi:hypothetical protein